MHFRRSGCRIIGLGHTFCLMSIWDKPGFSTFPPISGRMCILPVWLAFTEETMRQVPHKITCRRLQRFTGSCSFPFRTLYVPESWMRSELSMLWGFPAKQRKIWAWLLSSSPAVNISSAASDAHHISHCKFVDCTLYRKWTECEVNYYQARLLAVISSKGQTSAVRPRKYGVTFSSHYKQREEIGSQY